jgi:DNA-binding HxlR family transcriptional regulator
MPMQEGSYGQYCPIARAVDVLGERWSLLIVRDLLLGYTRFNDLARSNPRLSRSLLVKRLRQLQAAGIVERLDGDYELTPAGRELRPLVFGSATGARSGNSATRATTNSMPNC